MTYDPIIKDFMTTSSKLLKRGAKSKDPKLMWAILQNLSSVLDSFVDAAKEQMLVADLTKEIDRHNAEAK